MYLCVVLLQVVFVRNATKFEDVDTSHYQVYKKQNIYFENEQIQTLFYELLEHRCAECSDHKPFRTFAMMRDHMRKEHGYYYCEICVKHLKVRIFVSIYFIF